MPKFERPIARYDPVRDAAERWPSWTIEEKHLEGDSERFYLDHRIIVVDIDKWGGDRDRAWAHVIAHLDYGHHDDGGPDWLPAEQEQVAEGIADLRLDRLGERSWGMSQQ